MFTARTAQSFSIRCHLSEIAATKAYEKFRQKKVSRDSNPADEALAHINPPRLMNWCETWMARQGAGRSLVGAALQSFETDSRKRRILQTIAGMFPGRALLYKWKRADSPVCLLCNSDRETVCHIQCRCPRLEAARTAAHHQIAQFLWSAIKKRQRGNRDDFFFRFQARSRLEISEIWRHFGAPAYGTIFGLASSETR